MGLFERAPSVHFIGGTPRIGKSEISDIITVKTGMSNCSTDGPRAVKMASEPIEANPQLHLAGREGTIDAPQSIADMIAVDPAIDYYNKQSREAWKAVSAMALQHLMSSDKPQIYEGKGLRPEDVAGADAEFRASLDEGAVFSVNALYLVFTENNLDHIDGGINNWLSSKQRRAIEVYAEFNRAWNLEYEKSAKEYGFPVVHVNYSDMIGTAEEVIDLLGLEPITLEKYG